MRRTSLFPSIPWFLTGVDFLLPLFPACLADCLLPHVSFRSLQGPLKDASLPLPLAIELLRVFLLHFRGVAKGYETQMLNPLCLPE